MTVTCDSYIKTNILDHGDVMKKWIIPLLIAILFGISGWAFSFYRSSVDHRSLDNLNATNLNLMSVMNEISVQATQQTIYSQTKIQSIEDEYNSLKATLTSETSEKNTYKLQVITLNQSFEDMRNSVLCKNAPEKEWDYASNIVIAEQLKTFVGDTVGNVNKSDWTVIWNNSKSAIHNFYTSEFKVVFLVYLPEATTNPQIYYVNDQCYLDY